MHHGEVKLDDNEPGLKVTILLSPRVVVSSARA
jgi:hypothetical protein